MNLRSGASSSGFCSLRSWGRISSVSCPRIVTTHGEFSASSARPPCEQDERKESL